MQIGIPALPLLALTLAIGGVGGAAATRLGPRHDVRATAPARLDDPSARAALVDEDPAARGTEARSVERAPDGMFYVRARVNGQSIRFLVDTGASVMTLTAADATRLGITPRNAGFRDRLATAGGTTRMAWTRLGSVRLAGREVRGVRAAVVRSGLGVSLLGQNMLAELDSVRIEGDRLILG